MTNDQSLPSEDRVIMVSGANRGIGKAITERLYQDGYCLSLGVRRPEALSNVTATMQPERISTHQWEASDAAASSRWVEDTASRFGRIDGLINNAGVLHEFSVENEDERLLDEMWEVNVKAPLRLIRAALPWLKRSGAGRVVNLLSLSSRRVHTTDVAGYAMTKYAAHALTHAIRYAGWEHGVRATGIMPGWVATDMALSGGAPMRVDEMIQPESIAQLVSTVLALPNTASVVEIPINCVLEPTV
ncbi:MAG: SDR family NAD(P)-dependent oxidoreductase [Gammaproteobacteria bacterium]|nr:SDR family NAD(P)-dependent oxidoreductase [Gammaproteobacteria bacterium]